MQKIKAILTALLIAALLAGCANTAKPISDTSDVSSAAPVQEEPFVFNPHVWAAGLDEYYTESHKQALFNLIDALRAGEDTFECPSREIYEWCIHDVTLSELFPAACMMVNGESNDGTVPFENGVGRIYYQMPKDEFVKREQAFERDVTEVLDSVVKSSYSDFEKCFAVYDYMATEYTYNYDWPDDTRDGFTYNTFMTHHGICTELAGLYAYLLMQCGVDAIEVGSDGDNMMHAWTFITLDGKGYHSDVTWGLKSEQGERLYLNYFLMNDAERTEDGFYLDTLTVEVLYDPFKDKYDINLKADDDKYSCFRYKFLVSTDFENNVIEYTDSYETYTFNY
ncbi:MAG: hypothetical protein IJL87_05110 [Clostridia bacterium]|nr:hypothetical protein [Clostridia bacterium]